MFADYKIERCKSILAARGGGETNGFKLQLSYIPRTFIRTCHGKELPKSWRDSLLTRYHCGFCISLDSLWVVRIRQARKAETAPSRMACFGSHTATKMLSKKGCTCWKKKVGTLIASSRKTKTCRTGKETHRDQHVLAPTRPLTFRLKPVSQSQSLWQL